MTTAQVIKTSVTVNNNSPIQDYVHPDDHTQPTFDMSPGFKPFTTNGSVGGGVEKDNDDIMIIMLMIMIITRLMIILMLMLLPMMMMMMMIKTVKMGVTVMARLRMRLTDNRLNTY